jgi:hypothetical protein
MERRAAVEYLLNIAEKTDNPKFSTIVNDLARRVALSFEQKDVNLEKYCSKMAAELMFRDDYASANKLMKIAQDAKTDPDEILPLNEENTTEEEQELPQQETQDSFINKNLPPATKPVLPPLDSNKLQKFIQDLTQGGADLTTQEEESTDQGDSENNQDQMVEDLNSPQPDQQVAS